MITVVLVEPKIPQNTGNIGRLCAANNVRLHLVGEPAFSLSDSALKRAGLDYWPFLSVDMYSDVSSYFDQIRDCPKHLLTTKTTKVYTDCQFGPDDYLIFGSETEGLSESIRTEFASDCCTLPMPNEHVRSLNLANAVSIMVYHALYAS